jgi:hypothetical protein
MGGSFYHSSTLFLLKAEIIQVKGIKVYDFYLSFTMINKYIGPRIAQVQVFFQIPNVALSEVFPLETTVLTHLAYVKWFSLLSTTPDPQHRMQRVSRLTQRGCQCIGVIPTDAIFRSIHLIPQFGHVVPQEWNSFTVLEQCKTFYVNPFNDIDTYLNLA